MGFEKAFVTKKLTEIDKYLKELEDLLACSDKQIKSDSGKLHIAERLLQLIVDTIIDINTYFIRELNLPISEDYQSTFFTLAERGILPKNFAEKMAPIVGLRNRIVHRYESVDTHLFLSLLRSNVKDFTKYIVFIFRQLKK
ncbi:DUF86 domain-containing protein [Candidatus Uhrbacteria bacterium]|nr:DUF86 domain-containing protein [Candidatus Uhrbacteria bacterium]